MRRLRLAAAACAVLLIACAPVLFALFVAPRIVRPVVVLAYMCKDVDQEVRLWN